MTCLARTRDFLAFEKLGVIFGPDNKDVAIFPEKIGERFYTLHRPAAKFVGAWPSWPHPTTCSTGAPSGSHRPASWEMGQRTGGCGRCTDQDFRGMARALPRMRRETTLLHRRAPAGSRKAVEVIARSPEPFLIPELPTNARSPAKHHLSQRPHRERRWHAGFVLWRRRLADLRLPRVGSGYTPNAKIAASSCSLLDSCMAPPARARELARRFREVYPDAHCELDFRNPLELLVATILSAQCTDKRVNIVTKDLFVRCKRPRTTRKCPGRTRRQ